jgi:hypothetical protein
MLADSYNAPAPSTLYRKTRGARKFREVLSTRPACAKPSATDSGSWPPTSTADGWTDVFVANDGMLKPAVEERCRTARSPRPSAMRAGYCAVTQDGRK